MTNDGCQKIVIKVSGLRSQVSATKKRAEIRFFAGIANSHFSTSFLNLILSSNAQTILACYFFPET
jgi:hypothetical protein